MSYVTEVTGELTLAPPVPFKYFKDSPFYTESDAYDKKDPAIVFDVESWDEDRDEGTMTVRMATAIVPATDDRMRAYHIVEELVELLAGLPPGTEVTGYLAGSGAETNDLWRIYVSELEQKPVKVNARIVYPLSQHGLGPDQIVEGGRA